MSPVGDGSPPEHVKVVAERLRTALAGGDLAELAPLLRDDVRWGGEEDTSETCHSRSDVVSWYSHLRHAGMEAVVEDTILGNHSVVLRLGLTWPPSPADEAPGPDRVYQVFHVSDGMITDIRGYPTLEAALAEAAQTR